MAPDRVVGPIVRLIGYALFLVWCAVVAVAISAVSLARIGWMATGLARAPTGGR
ncbi:MAG TPA: hypothetical protein VFZ26_13170 [Gemmatimonadales bacterium]